MSLKSVPCLALLSSIVLSSIASAQSPASFKYSITDSSEVRRGGGELQISDKEKIGLEIGTVKADYSEGGSKIAVTPSKATDLSCLTEKGTVFKQAIINPDGSSIIRSFAKEGVALYQVTEKFDGSGKIEVYHNNKVKYVITISADGELGFNSVALSPATPAEKPATPAKPASTTTASTQGADTPKIQVTPNSPPPAPGNN